MLISARVVHTGASHDVRVATSGLEKAIAIPAKPGGGGSAVNGGEFLMLALASCYCNDLYREAARLGIALTHVEVEASAEFAGIGLAARNIRYRALVDSPASDAQVADLLQQTDAVAEVHNTLRAGAPVTRVPWVAQA
jgi:organic hydroperoxide reductase OsmC/OhrA